ncbi:MAG: acyl--CoA ligase [Sinobacteraceae bacterium]|nr:acyl--CoA ligase [Nevskiaceae bacterium]MCP5339973.1 acyl--CoA ligase [Nevskiaceae bacterium]MCP5360900.1 acyl--CoA ligase [Nevskiaceae bacterium]MCP5467435.1 acyl--CoA ligase [Nevskiaceae bacterium]MCP5470755.1 acyl--CoA ligase [Nevskiaceae bacterium]
MLHQLFRAAACLHSGKTAVVAHGRRLDYQALVHEAARLAALLRARGAQPGDRVGMLLANSAEAAVTVWAVLEAGCVLVPLHAASRKDALQPVLRDAELRWVVSAGELSASFAMLREALPTLTGLIVWAPRGGTVDGQIAWNFDASAALPAPGALRLPPGDDPEALATLIYTSGSTGEPKGVMLSHANMCAAVRAVNAYLRLESSDVLYSPLPLSSSYGLYQLILGLSLGATVVLDRSFAFPVRSLELLARERATVLAGVPTMYAWLAAAPGLQAHDLSSLRILTSAAASLPLQHARRVRERLPQARLFVMYGQTECKRISYLDPDDFERKPGSVGRGMPFQEHLVVDETGAPVPAGGTGELVVRGPHVTQGYWRRPEESTYKLRPLVAGGESWLHTGDLFRIDADGFLWFVGRQDDILKVGGNKVSPREVEEVLCQLEGVREAAVIGMPDEAWGQAVKAYIVRDGTVQLTAAEVVRFCSARLRGFMVPKAVMFIRDLPKTESGKIKKRELA